MARCTIPPSPLGKETFEGQRPNALPLSGPSGAWHTVGVQQIFVDRTQALTRASFSKDRTFQGQGENEIG